MLKLILSRRIPALLTRMSSCPKVSTAWSTSSLAPCHELTSEALTAPSLPPALISSTTSSAGCLSPPWPWSEAPTSLTMTLAPSDASSRASSRPIPRPAPVTIATLPSSIPMMSSCFRWCQRSVVQCPPCAHVDLPRRRAAILASGHWPRVNAPRMRWNRGSMAETDPGGQDQPYRRAAAGRGAMVGFAAIGRSPGRAAVGTSVERRASERRGHSHGGGPDAGSTASPDGRVARRQGPVGAALGRPPAAADRAQGPKGGHPARRRGVRPTPPRQAVRSAYNVLLRREPDEPAWSEQAGALTAGSSPTSTSSTGSAAPASTGPRCRSGRPACTAPSTSAGASSSSGCPRPRRIVDLGGGHTIDARGALVLLGYPVRLRRAGGGRPAAGRPAPPLPLGAVRWAGDRTGHRALRVPVDGRPLVRRRRLGGPRLQRAVHRARDRRGR